MDNEFLKYLEIKEQDIIDVIEYVQKCIEINELTLKAMGLLQQTEIINQSIPNSQLKYNIRDIEGNYAHFSTNY